MSLLCGGRSRSRRRDSRNDEDEMYGTQVRTHQAADMPLRRHEDSNYSSTQRRGANDIQFGVPSEVERHRGSSGHMSSIREPRSKTPPLQTIRQPDGPRNGETFRLSIENNKMAFDGMRQHYVEKIHKLQLEKSDMKTRLANTAKENENMRSLIQDRNDKMQKIKDEEQNMIYENGELRSNLAEINHSLSQTRQKVTTLENEVVWFQQHNTNTKGRIDELSEENNNLKSHIEKTAFENELKEATDSDTRSTLRKCEMELANANTRMGTLVEKENMIRNENKYLRAQLSENEQTLHKSREKATEDLKVLQFEKSNLVIKLNSNRVSAQHTNIHFERRIDELTKENANLKQTINQQRTSFDEELQEAIKSNKQRLRCCQIELENSKTKFHQCQEDLNASQREKSYSNTQSHSEVVHLQNENSQLTTDNSQLRTDNRQHEANATQLRKENSQLLADNTQLQADNTQLQADNTQLQADNTQLQADNTQLQADNTQLQADNTQLQADNTQLQEENIKLKDEATQLQTKNSHLKTDITRFQDENSLLKTDNTQLQTENSQLKAENSQLKAENSQFKAENSQLKAVTNEQQSEISQPKADITQLQNDHFKLKTDYTQLQAENSRLKADITQLHNENSALMTDSTQIQNYKSQLKAHNTQLQTKNRQLKADAIQSQNENSKLKTDNTQLQNEIRQLLADSTQLQTESSQMKAAVTQLQTKNFHLNATITQLQDGNSLLKTEKTQLQTENSQLKVDNNELHNKISQPNADIAQLQKANSELKECTAQLQKDNSQLRDDNTGLQKANSELKTGTTQLQMDNSQQVAVNTHLKERNSQLKADTTQLQKEHSQLKANNSHLLKEIGQLKDGNNHMQKANSQLNADNSHLQKENNYLKRQGSDEITTHSREYAALQNTLHQTETLLKQTQRDLEELQEEKRSSKIFYDSAIANLLQDKTDLEESKVDLEKRNHQMMTDINNLQRQPESDKKANYSSRDYEAIQRKLRRTEKDLKEAEMELEETKTRLQEEKRSSKTFYDSKIANLLQDKTDLEESQVDLEKRNRQMVADINNLQRQLESDKKANYSSRDYEAVQQKLRRTEKDLKEAEMELEDTKTRLSKSMGDKLTNNNPNIVDLSDMNRPSKLADRYKELYDNQWTDAYEILEDSEANEKQIIYVLLTVLIETKRFCDEETRKQMEETLKAITHSDKVQMSAIPVGVLKYIKDCRKTSVANTMKIEFEKYMRNLKEGSFRFAKQALTINEYLQECFETCWLMAIQDPPVVLASLLNHGDNFRTDLYSAYTVTGKIVEYSVWPALLLHDNGPTLTKGVAQGRKKV